MYNYSLNELKEKLLATNCFIDNEALTNYCLLIINESYERSEKGKTQKHHIIPKAYFKQKHLICDNSENNCVILQYSIHVLAHKYLMYCTKGRLSSSMASAFMFIIANHSCRNNEYELDFDQDIVQADYEKAYQLTKSRLALSSEEEIANRRAKFKNQHKGFIWICNKELNIQHLIDPKDIEKFPGFIRGKFSYSEESKANLRKGQANSILAQQARKKGLKTRLSAYEKKRANNEILLLKGNAKKVVCIDLGIEFNSIKEAKHWLGKGDIEACCRHKQIKAGNHFWAFVNDKDWIEKLKIEHEKLKQNNLTKISRSSKPGISVKCVETGDIFISIPAAKKWLIQQNKTGYIYGALDNKEATAGGFHWITVN